MLGSPQKDQFHIGGGGRLALEYLPLTYLGVEAHYGYFAFRLKSPGPISENAAYHDMGVGLRFHPAASWSVADPWISIDGALIETGGKWRGAPAIGAGLDFRAAEWLRVGPFIRYQQVIDSRAADAKVLLFGVSLGVGGGKRSTSPDADGDGVADDQDRCPTAPETQNGFEDNDGCPDEKPAAPAPAVEGKQASCPVALDSQGNCPEPDQDKDGISDVQDKCPNEAETANGYQDDDGCPDVAERSDKIKEVQDQILFETGSAELTEGSRDAIHRLARRIREDPGTRLVVEGHADDRGPDSINQPLSERRAEAVVEALIRAGAPRAQLRAIGYGSTRPLVKGDDESARQRNRRVQFRVEGEGSP